MKYSLTTLKKVLKDNGYKPITMTPEWSLLALQILQVEKLEAILKEVSDDYEE